MPVKMTKTEIDRLKETGKPKLRFTKREIKACLDAQVATALDAVRDAGDFIELKDAIVAYLMAKQDQKGLPPKYEFDIQRDYDGRIASVTANPVGVPTH